MAAANATLTARIVTGWPVGTHMAFRMITVLTVATVMKIMAPTSRLTVYRLMGLTPSQRGIVEQ